MSQLRAPDARPERREGGRHGRPGGRSHSAANRQRIPLPPPEVRIRPQLVRTALLPCVAAVLSGAAAVLFTVRASGIRPSASLWAALGGSGALAVAAVAAAYLGAHRVAGGVLDRALALRRVSAQGQADLQRVLEQLREGGTVAPRTPPPASTYGGDAFDLLAREMGQAQDTAVNAVVEAAELLRAPEAAPGAGEEQRVEVFVNLARRLQSLVHREIQILDELEQEVEDPDLLKGLFQVDHLATRIRRHAENLAVLGGAVSRRQWSSPVGLTEVLRSAIAEVEQYPRVKLVPPIDGTLRGHSVADVIHLLAELVENATVFSAPHTQVMLRAQHVTAGLALEVEDRGLGMAGHEQERMNALLADPDRVNVAHLLQDGRIGLFVVAALARRHGIAVRLQSNIYGGTQAVLVLPQTLLGAEDETPADGFPAPPPTALTGSPQPDQDHAHPGPGTGSMPLPGQPAPPLPQAQQAQQGQQGQQGQQVQPGRQHQDRPAHEQSAHERSAPDGPAQDRPGRSASAPEAAGTAYGTGPGAPQFAPVPPRQLRREGDSFGDGSEDRPGAGGREGQGPPLPQRSAGPASADRADQDVRPRLPRRAHQENLVPQLREAPAPRTGTNDVLHDPGLLAAFRRGIDLAEARSEQDHPAPAGPGEAQDPYDTQGGHEPSGDPEAPAIASARAPESAGRYGEAAAASDPAGREGDPRHPYPAWEESRAAAGPAVRREPLAPLPVRGATPAEPVAPAAPDALSEIPYKE
ncbi:ATP-binding protein [uncultured Streptomyces sp.]|uniref:ATP-binding protein n=1 Tax=uncultured Streptomyces sp. TaxID=174707 RepID=UPI0026096679|nr:ATP-binding protein [uncultured Streptomyces sp.]